MIDNTNNQKEETNMQHNISLDERSELILAEQKRGFNLSKFVRDALIELE